MLGTLRPERAVGYNPHMRTGVRALFFFAAIATGAANAQWGIWDSEFDENQKPWKEIEAKLPAYPKDGSQMAFVMMGARFED